MIRQFPEAKNKKWKLKAIFLHKISNLGKLQDDYIKKKH